MARKPRRVLGRGQDARESEDRALTTLVEQAQEQEQHLAGQRRAGRVPRYRSVEQGALESLAAEAQLQLQRLRRHTAIAARRHALALKKAAARHRGLQASVTAKQNDKLQKMQALRLAKASVRKVAKQKLTKRQQQLAFIARMDDLLTAKAATVRPAKLQALAHASPHGTKALDAPEAAAGSAAGAAKKPLPTGSGETGISWLKPGGGSGGGHVAGARFETESGGKASHQVAGEDRWHGRDHLSWPDGHGDTAAPLPAAAPKEAHSQDGKGGWKGLNTEWAWPQEGRKPSSEGVPAQLNLLLLVDGATRASMHQRQQGMLEAAVAEAAGVSLQQLRVDYAIDVPGLAGHMEASLRMLLVPGVSCAAVATKVRKAVESGQLSAMLSDFGAAGLAVSLLNMSGCPAAMMPESVSLPWPRESAPQADVGPARTAEEVDAAGKGWRAERGRAGARLTSEEAVDAAQQVATQTAQQVASEVATAAARNNAQQLESQLRTLAQRVATATATKVTQDLMRPSGVTSSGARGTKAGTAPLLPSALAQLEAAAARTAAQRYGP